jgi:uncharacterized protein YjeT (DUF2065 family)
MQATFCLPSRWRSGASDAPALHLLLCRWINHFPVGLHVDHGPAATGRLVQCLVELTDMRLAIIGKFPLAIGVVNVTLDAGR